MEKQTIKDLVHSRCTGCGACKSICPSSAISMIENTEGFFVPDIDFSACTKCGLCVKTCPQINDPCVFDRLEYPEVYGVKAKNKETVYHSSSGGMFSVLAEYVFSQNGIVIGAAFDKNFQLKHIAITEKKELWRLRGSKYIQSDTAIIYKECKRYLEEEKVVLFTGCPCQIAGLRAFLGKPYERLITADLICHGTPNQRLFNVYREWLQNKYGNKLCAYHFRSKQKGWSLYGEISFKSGRSKPLYYHQDPYCHSFSSSETYRESCYSCKYAQTTRMGDITIGDFWGVGMYYPGFAEKGGVSLVLLNTASGRKVFDAVEQNVDYLAVSMENAAAYNGCLKHSSERPAGRDNVYEGINTLSPNEYINTRLTVPLKSKITGSLRDMIPYLTRQKIKRWLKYKITEHK